MKRLLIYLILIIGAFAYADYDLTYTGAQVQSQLDQVTTNDGDIDTNINSINALITDTYPVLGQVLITDNSTATTFTGTEVFCDH